MKSLLKIACLTFVLWGGLVGQLRAQQQDVKFERLSMVKSGPEPVVRSLLQDRQGFLWLATKNGLYKHDGYDFTAYQHDPRDSTSISDNILWDVAEGRDGTLWIGAGYKGLIRFDPATEQFKRIPLVPLNPVANRVMVFSVLEDASGIVWAGSREALIRFDPITEQIKYYPIDPSAQFDENFNYPGARVLYEDRSGTLWVGTLSAGLCRFDREAETFTCHLLDPDHPDNRGRNTVVAISEDRAGWLWLGTADGRLSRFEPETGSFTFYTWLPDSVQVSNNSYAVFSIVEDRSGMLWLASEGLIRFDPSTEQFTRYEHDPDDPHSLSENDISTIYEDRQGTLWVGTWSAGLNKLIRPKFSYYRLVPDDPDSLLNAIGGMYEDASGTLWFGTVNGLFSLDPTRKHFTPYQRGPDAPHDWIQAIHEDASGMLWIGTDNGLFRYNPETSSFTHYVHDPDDPNSLGSNRVWPVYADREGVIWIGTWGGGVNRFDPEAGTFTHYVHDPDDPNSLRDRDWAPFPRIFSIYEDRQGTLWIGTEGGLNRFDRETEQFTHFLPDTTHTRFNNRVVAIHEDRSGRLWLGTYMGLVLFDRDTETYTYFNEQDGLADNFVNGILEDDAGNLWLSTNSGRLSRFIPATRTFRNFDGQDGLVNNFFYPGSHQRSRRGELIFGSPAGLVIFHPDSIQASTYVPPVALTSFEVFGRRVKLDQALPYTQEIELFPDQNTFSFEFTALDFSAPDRNLYAYKLEGFDADWMENGTRRRASYTNVPPGTYTFRVKGSSSDHVWNEEGVSVRLVITPPFWRTGWFYALVVIFGLSLIGVVGYGVRVRRLKAREQELSRMVEERTQALVAEKKKTEEQAEKLQEQADRLLELDRIKSRFFANISHEFRTPLTLLLGPLQDALDGEREMDALRRHLPTMHRNARRLLRLINQLLDLSKLEAGSMTLRARRANLIPLLRATAQAFTSMARRKHIRLQVQTPQEEIELYYEQDKLEKVFYNLLSNAFKYTPEGGTVSVSVEEGEGEASGFVEIVVRDTGRGIPAEDLPYIFDRFTTVNLRFHQVDASSTREHEGTGIGLALTKELVALHGGTIRVESELGRGTAIFIRLPRGRAHLHDDDIVDEVVGDEMQALAGLETFDLEASLRAVDEVLAFEGGLHERAGDGQPAGPLPEDAPTILIVEDNADVRGYLMSHLEGDYHVVEAADGVEGLEQAQAIKPDLVIVDVMMPRMDGYALCRALKADEKISHIPVVLLTARADEESKVVGLETGADDYLYKPFNAAELLARVENLIEIRRQLRERFSETIVVQPGDIEITSAEAEFLKQVQGIVEAHLADRQFSVEWLASEVALSRRQLDRRLRSLTRLSASGFIRKMRLERAAQLLVQQAGKVSEVAYAVGFQDVAHFSKLFHQTFGVSPSDYAKNSA